MNTPQPPEPKKDDADLPPERLSDAEWMLLLGNDDSAPSLLNEALHAVDPVPAWLPLGANVAWQTRALDAELFDLLSESTSVGAARSVAEDLRILVFGDRSKTLSIEVSIRHDVSGPVISGTLSGTGTSNGAKMGLSWEGSRPLHQEPVDLDQFGRFEILSENATRARIRLFSSPTSNETLLITPWFDIY